jgi:phosphatidylserine/phosphatidylglycerophosphate/cardiolipin synthase-like enzyme
MKTDLSQAIEQLVQEAPRSWLEAVCTALESSHANTLAKNLLQKLPPTHNGDLAYRLAEAIRLADGVVSWDSLSSAIQMCASLLDRWQIEHKAELLWAGPAPASGVPARRIDQVLYDLVADAKKDILLITFAAHKIQRLAQVLASASFRGVRVRLVLEFGIESKFQLSHDALKAFPLELQDKLEIFYWPTANRGLNVFGKPGKLHAKAAVVDTKALLTSANLTDDAFLRNLELGVLFVGGDMPIKLRQHFDHLIASGTLSRWNI